MSHLRATGRLAAAAVGASAVFFALTSPGIAGSPADQTLPPVQGKPVVSSPAAVEPAVAYLRDTYGMSDEEAQRRLALQERANGLDDDLRQASGADYAGLWLDQARDAKVHVAIVNDDEGRVRDAAAKRDVQVDVVHVSRSLDQLQGTQQRLERAVGQKHSEVYLNGIDLARNALSVHIAGQGAVSPDVQKALDEEGTAVVVTRGGSVHRGGDYACIFPYCDAPLRAGVYIQAVNGSGLNSQCTTGFNAVRSDGTPYVMTSGHCLIPVDGAKWYTRQVADGATHAIGNGSTFYRYKDSTGDAGLIGLDNPAGWNSGSTLVNYGFGQATLANENYNIRARSGSTVGTVLCFTGAQSKTACGTVDKLDATSSTGVGGLGRLANVSGQPGDSGGPVFANNVAYGLIQGGDFINGVAYVYYQGVLGAESRLGVIVRTSP